MRWGTAAGQESLFALNAIGKRRWLWWAICWGTAVLLAAPLVWRWFAFQGPFGPVAPPRPEPVIDIHCHTAGIGAGESGCFVSNSMRASYKFNLYLKSFGVDLGSLEAQGDRLIIQRIAERIRGSQWVSGAIVLAMDGVIDSEGQLDRERTEFFVPNEFVYEQTALHPGLFWGASINPLRKDAIDRLDWAHAHGAKLVKWLPSVQLFDPGDDRHLEFYRKMVELDLPLLSHAGQERAFTHVNDEFGDPFKLRLALDTGVRVIVAHIASTGEHEGERDTDRLIELMGQYGNLYSDISSLTQVNKLGYLREAVSHSVFRERLFYGSDYPLINTAIVSPWLFSLNLEVGEMRRIAGIENPWDRDVELKRSLGVPPSVFERANRLIMKPGDLVSVRP